VPRFDVVIMDTGNDLPSLLDAACEAFELQERGVRRQLVNLPCTLARAVPFARAEAAAAMLRGAGAAVDLVRNDG
jgi:hypothetical protein